MREEILSNIDNPRQLEKLYRENRAAFKKAFLFLYPQLRESQIAAFWHERLHYGEDKIFRGTEKELLLVIAASLMAGFIAKLPFLIPVTEGYYYPRNVSFIIFPLLSAYFAWKNRLHLSKILLTGGVMLLSLVYINLLPDDPQSDTLALACIHLPLFLWTVLGFSYVGNSTHDLEKRLDFLRYNGEAVVVSSLIGIAGILLTGITIGLFSLIGFDIEKFYTENVVIFGLAAIPVVGTFLTQNIPQLVRHVSPVIAKIFSPLVLLTLLIYLSAIIFSGKNPYHDREFLLVFNALLIGVMAIIFFSVAEGNKTGGHRIEILMLFILSLVTIIVNGIALSAIVFRITEWGITPNRLAVLGGNILILTNLLMVSYRLFRSLNRKADVSEVGNTIALFLPVYSLWAFFVTFFFPLIFWFR